ncbi:LysR family transcriptional regulator, partial [Roseomonas sp. DSM 102946]|nr:LysR family transcriptional regulator [Roseomonas sp. DSM 102946]
MRPPAIDLRLLRQFVAVAEELHFRRAASRLNISQPPLTAAVKRLEEEIGAVLLERGRRTVALTPAGRTLLEEARKLLGQAELAVAATRDVAAGRRGLVRLAYVGSAMYGRLPGAIAAFRRSHPGVRLVLTE